MKTFKKPGLLQKILYYHASWTAHLYFKLFNRLEIHGLENVPKTGGVLLCSNHVSYADPPLIGATVRRMIHFFAKQELFLNPLMGWYLKQLNAFPVKRFSHDVGAFKQAQHLLELGEAVVLFPEGHRSKTGELGKAKAGVGMLAYKANVPAVPIYINNSKYARQFRKVKIFFGAPLHPAPTSDEKNEYQPFSDKVLEAVAALKSKCYNEF